MNQEGNPQRIVGQTRSVGFQIGVRKTFPVPLKVAWQTTVSAQGLKIWLGETEGFKLVKGASFLTRNGTRGTVRVLHPNGHLRVTWQPPLWPRASTIQIRVIPNGEKTVISFHQEHLPGPEAREQMRRRWQAALAELGVVFAGPKTAIAGIE